MLVTEDETKKEDEYMKILILDLESNYFLRRSVIFIRIHINSNVIAVYAFSYSFVLVLVIVQF